MSVEYVKLKHSDLELLIDTFQEVVEYKYQSLAKHNWQQFEDDYLKKAIDALSANQFKVADPHNSILTWFIDQIIHSRRVVTGINKKDWIPLPDIEKCQSCLSMLRAASKGQISYNIYASGNTTFKTLFEDNNK